MASPAPVSSPEARIINHMNADHARDLSIYLQHHMPTLALSQTLNPTMKSISLSSITIASSAGTDYTIPFFPPLSSLTEARTRLVAMTAAAREALNLGPVDISIFAPPCGLDLLPFTGISAYFLTFIFLSLLITTPPAPATAPQVLLDSFFPGGAAGFEWMVRTMFWPVLAIHVVEGWWFDQSRCARYGISRGSRVWFLWVACTFLEGFTAFKRFDGLVEGLMRKKK